MKAISVGNATSIGMILLQAVIVGAIGYSLGRHQQAFFHITEQQIPTRGLVLCRKPSSVSA
ncbi:MAG: hypothetical protein U1F34_04640 [Gammaproteobacteria bacterium]